MKARHVLENQAELKLEHRAEAAGGNVLGPMRRWSGTPDLSTALKIAVLAAILIGLYGNVVTAMVVTWWEDEAYSHGFLVVPLALYVAWHRRDRILVQRRTADIRGLGLTLFACLVYLAGRLGADFFLTRSSLALLLAGLSWSLGGVETLRKLTFPLLLLFTAIPLPELLYKSFAAPLQLFASAIATMAAQAIGVAVYRDGNIIHLAGVSLGVAEACSGLRSMSSLVVSALVLGYLQLRRLGPRTALIVLAVPVAIVMNVLRVTGTAVLADYKPDLALGFYHSFSGWLVFLAGFGVLLAASGLLRLLFERGTVASLSR